MTVDKELERARKNTMHESSEPQGLKQIRGYDFDSGVDFSKIVDSFAVTGHQASEFSKAIAVINSMIESRRKEGCVIYLGYTSNMVSSGLREVFRYLVKHKMVDVIVTTAGGIEEDFIKCLGPFLLGEFSLSGATLREQGINRIGNILVPNKRYCDFEDFITPILERVHNHQKKTGEIMGSSEFISLLGVEIEKASPQYQDSIYYWAAKHNIPVFCPALTDGSIGDMLYFFSFKHPELKMDMVADVKKLNDITLDAKKTGVIILGAGVVKHHILNTNMLRNGADYSVYVNTSQEFDGSDAGARPDEAVSWGKLLPESQSVKVFGDATILFPLMVAKTFAKNP